MAPPRSGKSLEISVKSSLRTLQILEYIELQAARGYDCRVVGNSWLSSVEHVDVGAKHDQRRLSCRRSRWTTYPSKQPGRRIG